jgi:hypothetical protein
MLPLAQPPHPGGERQGMTHVAVSNEFKRDMSELIPLAPKLLDLLHEVAMLYTPVRRFGVSPLVR